MSKNRNAIVVSGAIVLFVVFTALAGYFGQEEKADVYHSSAYNDAYEFAKGYGKSDLYAKTFAEKIVEGKDGVYSEAYAEITVRLQDRPLFNNRSPAHDRATQKYAEVYAEKRFEGKDREYSRLYALTFCLAFLSMEKVGKSEAYIHSYTKHNLIGRQVILKRRPMLTKRPDSLSVVYFSTMYGLARADGESVENAIIKAEIATADMTAERRKK